MDTRTLAALIRGARMGKGLTQEELAKAANVGRSWLSLIEGGHRMKPDRDKLEQLAVVLELPVASVLAAAGYRADPVPPRERRPLQEIIAELEANAPLMLPVEEAPLSGGAPFGVPVEYQPYLPVPEERNHDFACFRVSGDCLAPLIEHGDKVIVDRTREWTEGDIVAVVHDGELLVKGLVQSSDDQWLLEAADGTSVCPGENTRVLGVVVDVVKRVVGEWKPKKIPR